MRTSVDPVARQARIEELDQEDADWNFEHFRIAYKLRDSSSRIADPSTDLDGCPDVSYSDTLRTLCGPVLMQNSSTLICTIKAFP